MAGYEFQHGQPVTRAAGFFQTEFIPASHVPGHDPDMGGIFTGEIMTGKAESKKSMDILPADEQADCRNQGKSDGGKKPENEKAQQDNEEQREKKGQQGDEPPFVRMQKGVAAAEQKKDAHHHIQQNQKTFGEFPN